MTSPSSTDGEKMEWCSVFTPNSTDVMIMAMMMVMIDDDGDDDDDDGDGDGDGVKEEIEAAANE